MNLTLRKLARSSYWQNLYSYCKEISSLKMFSNTSDLTSIQTIFLGWISIYNSLYSDLAREEQFISEEVIESNLRTDCYLLYKRKIKDKKNIKVEKPIDKTNTEPSIIFRRKS